MWLPSRTMIPNVFCQPVLSRPWQRATRMWDIGDNCKPVLLTLKVALPLLLSLLLLLLFLLLKLLLRE